MYLNLLVIVIKFQNKYVKTYFSFQKMDLGPCNKIHEAALKADFEIASKKRDYGYDVDVST